MSANTHCTADPCTNPLPPGHFRFCSRACMWRQSSRNRRRTDWSTKGERHPRTAAMWEMRAELDAEGGKGRCIFCVKPLPKGRRLYCGAEACEADYQHLYHLGEMAERSGTKAAPSPEPCANGCGGATRMGANHRMTRFCSDGCQKQFNWMKASRERTEERATRRRTGGRASRHPTPGALRRHEAPAGPGR